MNFVFIGGHTSWDPRSRKQAEEGVRGCVSRKRLKKKGEQTRPTRSCTQPGRVDDSERAHMVLSPTLGTEAAATNRTPSFCHPFYPLSAVISVAHVLAHVTRKREKKRNHTCDWELLTVCLWQTHFTLNCS